MRRIAGAALIAFLTAACGAKSPPAALSKAADVVAAPRVVSAAAVHQEIGSGRPVVLLFMATGCESCAAEAKSLAAALSGRGDVHAFGVDMAGSDDTATLRSFLADVGVGSLPIGWTVDTGNAFAQRYGIKALSATVGLADGRVRFVNQAGVPGSMLRRQIAGL